MARTCALPALLLAAALASAQNRDHPGLVCAGKDGWVPRAEAESLGFIEYRGRWLPRKLLGRLLAWEKEDPRHAEWRDAWKTESRHYRITSNLPRHVVELEIAPFLDELYQTYVRVFASDFGISGKSANKKFIKIYKGYADYAKHEAGEAGPPPRSTPGYIVGGSELVVYYEETDPALFYGTVFHEGAHQFFQATLPGAALPVWMDEGLATYFEGCTYSRCSGKITVGHLPPDRVLLAQEALRRAGTEARPAEMFMNVPRESFDALHYALGWSFLYYLTHAEGGRHRQAFVKFLRATNGAGVRPIPEVFRRATGMELASLEPGWREFVLGLKPERMPSWVELEVGGAKEPGVDLRTGDLLWSLDGVEIYDAEDLARLWADRGKDRPHEVVVVRRDPAPAPIEYSERFVAATIPAGSRIEIGTGALIPRNYNLRD